MNRRGFLGLLGGVAATAVLDPERLLWVPGQKTISIPSMIVTPDETGWQVIYSDVTETGVALEYRTWGGGGERIVTADLTALFKGLTQDRRNPPQPLHRVSRWSSDPVAG